MVLFHIFLFSGCLFGKWVSYKSSDSGDYSSQSGQSSSSRISSAVKHSLTKIAFCSFRLLLA